MKIGSKDLKNIVIIGAIIGAGYLLYRGLSSFKLPEFPKIPDFPEIKIDFPEFTLPNIINPPAQITIVNPFFEEGGDIPIDPHQGAAAVIPGYRDTNKPLDINYYNVPEDLKGATQTSETFVNVVAAITKANPITKPLYPIISTVIQQSSKGINESLGVREVTTSSGSKYTSVVRSGVDYPIGNTADTRTLAYEKYGYGGR